MQHMGVAAEELHAAKNSQDGLLRERPLPFGRSFFPLGYGITIETDAPEALEAAEESFGHARSTHSPTRLRILIEVTQKHGALCPPEPARYAFQNFFSMVADADNHALLDLKTGVNCTWVTQAALQNRLYFRTNFLEKVIYLLLGASVVTDLHAACVSKSGKGILLCGPSGAGKSTLAYACARQGWTYTSDDTSYLINAVTRPRVIGHCHRARFRPEARELFPELAGRAITPRMEGKPSIEVPTAELPVESAAAEADVRAIAFLKRRQGAAGRLLPLSSATAIDRMRRELYSAGEIRLRHEAKLELFHNTPAYQLEYCDLKGGIESLEFLASRI